MLLLVGVADCGCCVGIENDIIIQKEIFKILEHMKKQYLT